MMLRMYLITELYPQIFRYIYVIELIYLYFFCFLFWFGVTSAVLRVYSWFSIISGNLRTKTPNTQGSLLEGTISALLLLWLLRAIWEPQLTTLPGPT